MPQRRRKSGSHSSPTPDGGSRRRRTRLGQTLEPLRDPNVDWRAQQEAMGQLYNMMSGRTAEQIEKTMPSYRWNPMMIYPATGSRTGADQNRASFLARNSQTPTGPPQSERAQYGWGDSFRGASDTYIDPRGRWMSIGTPFAIPPGGGLAYDRRQPTGPPQSERAQGNVLDEAMAKWLQLFGAGR